MAICPCHANVYAMWAGGGQNSQRTWGVLLHPTWAPTSQAIHAIEQDNDKKVPGPAKGAPSSYKG